MPQFNYTGPEFTKNERYRILKEIKNNKKLSKIPVIVFTTSSLEENESECNKKGANAYITKLVNFDGFKPLIKLLKEF